MASIGKISIGVNTKRYKHPLNHHVNTTCEFGFPQPIFQRPMAAGDKLSYDCRQLVRFNSLVAPTFGECKSINVARFIPMCDVYPAYDALLAHTPIGTTEGNYIPSNYPCTSNCVLALLLCGLSYELCLKKDGTRFEYPSSDTSSPYLHMLQWFVDAGTLSATASTRLSAFRNAHHPQVPKPFVKNLPITLDNADYVVMNPNYNNGYRKDTGASWDDTEPCCFIFRFSQTAARIAKVLRGLGYNLELTNNDSNDILPILAYYKAWFDLYAPKRNINFHATDAYHLINLIYQTGFYDLNKMQTGDANTAQSAWSLFTSVLLDLNNCFYGLKDDWFSVHRPTPTVTTSFDSSPLPSTDIYPPASPYVPISSSTLDGQTIPRVSSGNSFSLISIETLKRISRFINKNTIFGQDVKKYIAVHYGAKTAEDMFSGSYNIGQFVLDCIPDDIMNSADTATVDSQGNKQGAYLGQYGGFCKKFSNGKFKFRASEPGFIIIINTVIPVAEYYQGSDPTLYQLDRFTIPNTEFDALGYQLTPRSQMWDNNGICDFSDNVKLGGKSFGFVPYMSSQKVRQNLVNGDFRNRSFATSYEPFFLDRKITPIKVNINSYTTSGQSHDQIDISHFDIPLASTAWRLAFGNKALGNFDRIFNNQAGWDPDDPATIVSRSNGGISKADNIILQCNVSCTHTNALKPLSMSFDTFEDTTDNDSISVNPE